MDSGEKTGQPAAVSASQQPCQGTTRHRLESGFHSMIEVLLKGGAAIDLDGWNGTMARALRARRFDIVQLLVEHGYDPKQIDMKDVFNTWDPAMMEYFIDKGADVETGNPLAWAFCNRIRTALRVFKRYQE
jgi:hypothetical protein